MRSYEHLQQQGIIYTRRGLGYFASADAVEKVTALRKEQFLQEELRNSSASYISSVSSSMS